MSILIIPLPNPSPKVWGRGDGIKLSGKNKVVISDGWLFQLLYRIVKTYPLAT
jgi:hypothetical protein